MRDKTLYKFQPETVIEFQYLYDGSNSAKLISSTYQPLA